MNLDIDDPPIVCTVSTTYPSDLDITIVTRGEVEGNITNIVFHLIGTLIVNFFRVYSNDPFILCK